MLVDIPATAQGPMYHTYKIDEQRDRLGFTNPNLHRRICRLKSDVGPILPEPTPQDTTLADYLFELNDDEASYTIVVYGGSSSMPKVIDTINDLPVTVIGSEAFSGANTSFVYIPEGVLEIK